VLLDTLKASVLPQFFSASWLEDIPIVFSDFPSRIRIGYVLRKDGAYSYVLKDDFQRLGITVAELHAIAVENLSDLTPGRITLADLPGGSEGFIDADDNFAAARILLPEARTMFASRLGDSFLVTLPHRDSCFCWSLTQPPERQAQHAAEALEDFIDDDYRLTPDILLAASNGFSMYKEQWPGG
jgi:uncharacterized protein YtpQ (UPF0354 family)